MAIVRPGASDRHEPRNWLSVFGDGELLATRHPIEESGQMSLCLIGADFTGHRSSD
jgi:hypothetical protein